jgi:hypothetical protein
MLLESIILPGYNKEVYFMFIILVKYMKCPLDEKVIQGPFA